MATGETSLTLTYGPLLTTTLMKVLDSNVIHENVFNNDPMLQWMKSGQRIKVIDGGERIRVNIMWSKNSTAKWYSDYDTLDTTAQIGQTPAFFNWKQGSVSISVSGNELRLNKGPSRLVNLQQDKIAQATSSLTDLLAIGAYSDGTGQSSTQMTGLEAMIATTITSGTYASINFGTNTAWRNQIEATVGAAATNLIPKMRTLYNSCSQGKGGLFQGPDAIFTTQTVYEALEALIFPMFRYSDTSKVNVGIGKENSGLMFKGASVMWDAYCTSGDLYMLNSNNVMMFIHQDANLSMAEGGFQKPINQDALVTQILFQGNMATNNRRKLGKLQGIT